jgi:hypothetical protein
MGRIGLSTIQKEEVRQIVFDCYIQKASVSETIDKIKSIMNIKLGENWIWDLRMKMRHSAKIEMQKYAKDRYAYIQKYLDRIHAVESLERLCWQRLKHIQDEDIKLNYITELKEIEVLLVDLYNNLPQVTGPRINGYENTNHTTIQQEQEYSEDDRKL